jgi:hypothetical protein
VVADGEQAELAAAERGSVRSVAGQGERLEQQRPCLQRGAGAEGPVDARLTGDLDSAPRRQLGDCRVLGAGEKARSRRVAHRCCRSRKSGDAADVVPVSVRCEHVSDVDLELAGACGNPRHFVCGHARIDEHCLGSVGE